MYRGSRARGGYHAHSYRDTATHGYRGYQRRSASPPFRPQRRSRGRSRSPVMVRNEGRFTQNNYDHSTEREHQREHYRPKHEGNFKDHLTTRYSRERSFSMERKQSPRRYFSRERSRDNQEEWRERHKPEESNREVKSRPKNDKYHWTSENYKKNDSRTNSQQDSQGDEVHDLREIIKRRGGSAEDCSRDDDEYFKEFVPNVQETRRSSRHKSRWTQNNEMEVLSFQKSIHNEIADQVVSPEEIEQPQEEHISTMDSNPEIPYFNGTDQELTPRQFVKLIEEVGYKKKWSSSDLKCQMAGKLLGAPREWFLKDELMNEPWDKVKVQFIKMHPMDIDYYQQLKKMLDRVMFENESFSNYFTFKTMLMSAVDITGRRAVSCLIGGLQNHELELLCYQKNFPTPELLFDYLSLSVQKDTQKQQESEGRRKSTHSFTESPRKLDRRRGSISQSRGSNNKAVDTPRDREPRRERKIENSRETDANRERERVRERENRERGHSRDRKAGQESRDREHRDREPVREKEPRERETHRDREPHRERDAHREPYRDREPPRERERERQLNNSQREEEFRQSHNHEAFIPSKPEYDQRHVIRVNIANHQLDAYNDLSSQCVTMKEETAKYIHLDYSRRRTTIIGFRGVPVMTLGDVESRLSIDQVSVKCTIFIVPNICQEKAIIIGQSLREHQDVNYREASNGVVFKQRAYLDSFSANEARKEKANHIV